MPRKMRLDYTDAQFVDVIHSDINGNNSLIFEKFPLKVNRKKNSWRYEK